MHIQPFIYHRYINTEVGKCKRKNIVTHEKDRTKMYVVHPNLGVTSTKRASHLVTLDSLKVTISNDIIAVHFLLLRAFTNTFIGSYNCNINAAILAAPFTGSNLNQPRPLSATEILFIITNTKYLYPYRFDSDKTTLLLLFTIAWHI